MRNVGRITLRAFPAEDRVQCQDVDPNCVAVEIGILPDDGDGLRFLAGHCQKQSEPVSFVQIGLVGDILFPLIEAGIGRLLEDGILTVNWASPDERTEQPCS